MIAGQSVHDCFDWAAELQTSETKIAASLATASIGEPGLRAERKTSASLPS